MSRNDEIQREIADKLVGMVEAAQASGNAWEMPWNACAATGMPVNAVTGRRYNGINIPMLACESMAKGYAAPLFATFGQWKSIGATVQKGQKATKVVFWMPIDIKDESTGKDKKVWFLRVFSVFNASQVDGYDAPTVERPDVVQANANADAMIAASGVAIRYQGQQAFYSPASDVVTMPPAALFKSTQGFYSTLLHELTHATGHADRCARDFKACKVWGDEHYAAEELVAETGAAMLCAITGVSLEVREDHAQYIASWLKAIKSNPRALFDAFKLAGKAVDFLEARLDASHASKAVA
jgi:antirestriction protein ArdC